MLVHNVHVVLVYALCTEICTISRSAPPKNISLTLTYANVVSIIYLYICMIIGTPGSTTSSLLREPSAGWCCTGAVQVMPGRLAVIIVAANVFALVTYGQAALAAHVLSFVICILCGQS